jgi:hypothetical protein
MTPSLTAALLAAVLAWMERVGRPLEGLAPTHWGC